MNLINRIRWWLGWYSPSTQPLWHVHHDRVVGCWRALAPLWSGGLSGRQQHIAKHKPINQIGIRIRLLKPVKGRLPFAVVANIQNSYPWYLHLSKADLDTVGALHAAECAPDCPMLHGADSICPTS